MALSMHPAREIVTPKVSSEWIKIALLMKFELSDTHNIKIKNEDDPKKCWTEIFERWLLAGRKWENLLPILEEVLDSGTFESIKKAYAGPVAKSMSQTSGSMGSMQKLIQEQIIQKASTKPPDEVERMIINNPSLTLKNVSMSSEAEKKPRLKHLNGIFVEKHATKWRDIAIQLDIPTEDLEIIEVDNPSVQERCRVMLLVWLQRDPKASWKRLHDVLEAYRDTGVKTDLKMEHISRESYPDLKEWKFVDTVQVNHLPPHDEKINYIKDFPVAVFSVTSDKQSQDSYSPTVPNRKIIKSCEHYTKVRMPIPSDHHIFELSESDNVIKLLCIKKSGTQFEKILSEILNSEPLEDLYSLTKIYKNVFLLFIRPVPIDNEDKEEVKSKPEDITSFEEAESCSTETKTDALKKTCKIFLKNIDKLGKLLASKEKKAHDPYTKYVVEEREPKAAYIRTMHHVSDQIAQPNWNEVQVTEARYPEYHGDLLLGLPVAGFTTMPLVKSIYPFLGDNGNEYYQVKVQFTFNEYFAFIMHKYAPPSPHPAQIHLLCIRNDPNDPKSIRIAQLLGNRLLTPTEITSYFQGNTDEKIIYFIENIDIKQGYWSKIEKENYDFGAQIDVHPNMTNIQLLEAWITGQEERIIMEFIYFSILCFIIQQRL